MLLQKKPIAGDWYNNLAGQLIQIRLVVFVLGRRNRAFLNNISHQSGVVPFVSPSVYRWYASKSGY